MDTPAQPTEAERVYSMRLKRAMDLGVPFQIAEVFADTPTADLHRLEHLITEKGCRPLTAARILI